MMNSGRTYYRGRDSQNPNMINNDGTGGGHHPSMNMNQTETPMPTSLRVTPMDAEVFGQEIHDKFQELEIPSTQVPRDYVPNVKSVDDLFMEDERSSANYATTIADDDVIHVEGTIDDRVTIDKWTDATFAEPLMNNIKRANYVMPRAIQKTAIPLILDNYDVLGHAETGSGKTAAYLIPIISECIDAKASGKFKSESGHPYCIILTPTRELVRQCFEQACKFANETGVTVAKSYGDYPTRKNKEEINRGCDILCITPGRFKHFADDGSIAFNKLRFFVLDEGDHLLSANFLNDIRPIMELPSFPKGNLRQTLFFSATFTEDMLKIAKEFMRSEGFRAIVSNRKNVVNKKCEQEFVAPEPTKKFAVLVDFLRNELAKGFLKKTLVFANTKEFVEKLCVALTFSGIIAKSISSIKSQNVREKNLELFKNFSRDGAEQLDVLVVSDVCARGIDIKELDLVINFDMPNDYDTYIHRAGRVGRIRQGKCISYVSNRSRQISLLKEIKQAMEKSGQIVPPSLEEILRAEEVKESQPSFGQNIENSFANDVNNKTEEPAADIPTEKVNDKAVEVDNVEKKEEENKPEVSETVANAVDEKVDTAPVEAGNVEEKVDNAAGEEAVASAVDAEKKVDTAAGETVAPDFSTEVVEKEKKSFESDW